MQLLNSLFVFLANSPGNLVYILVVIITLTFSLQGAISQWRMSGYPQARRLIFGLAFLLGIQAVLIVISGLMEKSVIQGLALLPVLDRTALLLSLIWMLWLWAFPEPSRAGDAATILMSLLVAAAAVFGSVAYLSGSVTGGSFNTSPQAIFWDIGGLLILALSLGVLIARKPANWGIGAAVAMLAAAGFILDIIFPATKGDFSGIVRFFILAAFPLLLTLSSRFSASSNQSARIILGNPETALETSHNNEDDDEESQAARERRRYSTDPKTLQSLLTLAAEMDATKVNQYIARSVAQALLVDLCFLIYVGDDKNSLFIATGYDLIREENLEGGIVNREAVPMLANAVLRGRPLRLPASTTSSDLKGLGDLLGLPNPGNLLNVPIMAERGPIGSILLLSPYSSRVWNADDQTFLTSIASSFVPILERSQRTSQVEQDRERALSTAKDAVEQAMRLKTTNDEMIGQVTELKSQLDQANAETARQREMWSERARQLEQNQLNQQSQDEENVALAAIMSSNSQLENDLRMTLSEMAHLQNQLAESNTKLLELESKPSGKISTDQAEVVASISQELRQPMSSIIGYADLLLGESVGILGALQRKFIERIRTSTERIGGLVDDLIQMTTLEAGLVATNPVSVDLNLIIDNAMAYTSSQMREKNITLRIDIPENLQPLHADREALQQILIHLLQNAGAATPVEGSVTLRVRTQKEAGSEYVIIQVSDTGGGIPKEDLSRVFSRLYRAENALIQGVGDTGVGLSIAKTLTDAQGGRIWVDSEMGTGSTFSVSLPLKSASPATEISQGA
jgi:signal transduction histidine kinase